MKKLLISALALSAIHAGFAQKATPLGSMVVLPVADPLISSEACWKDANVVGVLLRVNWWDVEHRNGTYDWSFFTNGIQLAAANNKWVVLTVNGSSPPHWIYLDGVPQWKSSAGRAAPYPWNSTVQSTWSALITDLAAQFDGQAIVHAVSVWCGGTAIESYFAVSTTDAAALDQLAGGGAGSGAAFWESAAKTLITDYLTSFKQTPLYLATGTCYPDNDATMTDLVNWFLGQTSGIRGMESDALSEYYPSGVGIFPHTTLETADLPLIMYQDLQAIGNPKMKGATLAEVIAHGEKENAKAIQVYPTDPATDEGALAGFNTYIGAP
jgi:hypothetical protein